MIDILNIGIKKKGTPYDKLTMISKITDKMKCSIDNKVYVKGIDLNIYWGRLPQNKHQVAYESNIKNVTNKMKNNNFIISPKGIRDYDYYFTNDFQKDLFSYSVVESIKLILRRTNKSLKTSTILIDEASDIKVYGILKEISKSCRHIILLSKNIKETLKIQQNIISNFGISPEVTWDEEYALKLCDFVISTKDKPYEFCNNVWYINNQYLPLNLKGTVINDISFNTQWNELSSDVSPELIGAILSQMQEKDIESALRYNGVFMHNIKFNESLIDI
ncbi:Uncharacterised protein [Clostridium putrefaciens]|uniref:Uncharacterized protein n=1 Tax=Clostridium putrefaciens TaxID=99675 RepID=A0A381JB31_9CLOT|nr:hypothetical protein [Clostridium putrefaciens]SUY48315.1 Uncharacterised protein [Clostridium putrefaciens]